IFRDTINLPQGCYTFVSNDDGCDGISWWANSAGGTGTLRFTSNVTPQSYKTFNGDFGCQIMERFTVGYALSVKETVKAVNTFQSFPNPASSVINVLFDVSDYQDVSYSIADVSGKQVQAGKFTDVSSTIYPINTSELSAGMYFVTCHFAKGDSVTKKIIINK
ncbi:MAG: T9SS type A sorting domain-containing protein, partial [Bacteroidia bacterium]|nr:T9SS type A sorting domain-containing protein [Bacteroidia bacterium]